MESIQSESYSFRLKSHPDKRLVDHLRKVGQLSRKTVKDKSLNIDEKGLLMDVAYLMGVTHDLGKATSFQEYIIEKMRRKKIFQSQGEHAPRFALLSLLTP